MHMKKDIYIYIYIYFEILYGLFVYFYMLIRYCMYIILLNVVKIGMLLYNIGASRTLGDLRVMWLFKPSTYPQPSSEMNQIVRAI